MSQPSVAVIICAYTEERWPDLLKALGSVRRQTLRVTECILVIDHNPGLFARARAEWPDVIVIENTGPRGVSGARNTGIAIARSDLIAFLDDDAVAEPDWLAYLTQPFVDERVLGTGGALEPNWVGGRPSWFPSEFQWVVGCTYRGLPTTTAPVRNPIGGSFCMRRAVFDGVGLFGAQLGRVGKTPLGCEETDLSIRARRRWPTGQFVFEPRARVLHTVPRDRARWRYFRARCYAEGISKAVLASRLGSRDGLAAERRYVTSTLPTGVVRGMLDAALRGDTAGAARAAAIVGGLAWTTLGYLVGRFRLRFQRHPYSAGTAA
jgi:GT2 family glycosyltransferase